MKIHFSSGGDFLMGFFAIIFYIPYIFYIAIHSLFVSIFYKILLKYNVSAFLILLIVAILNYTGFCYTRGHYLSKAEQIDIGLEGGYLYTICFDEGWKSEKLKDCPYTLEKLKIEYPQCFTDDRPDDCDLYKYRKKYEKNIFNRFLGHNSISAIYSKQLTSLTKSLYNGQYYTILSSGTATYVHDFPLDFFDENFKTRSGE
jgi:hypothetical protein